MYATFLIKKTKTERCAKTGYIILHSPKFYRLHRIFKGSLENLIQKIDVMCIQRSFLKLFDLPYLILPITVHSLDDERDCFMFQLLLCHFDHVGMFEDLFGRHVVEGATIVDLFGSQADYFGVFVFGEDGVCYSLVFFELAFLDWGWLFAFLELPFFAPVGSFFVDLWEVIVVIIVIFVWIIIFFFWVLFWVWVFTVLLFLIFWACIVHLDGCILASLGVDFIVVLFLAHVLDGGCC